MPAHKIITNYKEHIHRNVIISDSGCWIWQKCILKSGYGYLKIGVKGWRVHRLAYDLFKGPITEGMEILHSCDTPSCCNPDHLVEGSHQANMTDMRRKNRQHKLKGEDIGASKVTEQMVLEIRAKYVPKVYTQQRLAEEFGIDQTQISNIILRKSWSHI